MISAIVAMSKNGVIGINGRLPWILPEELKHFTNITMGHHIILGRKTHESIGRPLEGRKNLIVSRDENYQSPGCTTFSSVKEAITFAKTAGDNEVIIGGGAKIYSDALFFTNRLYITIVDTYLEGDTFFPAFDWHDWKEVSYTHHEKNNLNKYNWDLFILDKKI